MKFIEHTTTSAPAGARAALEGAERKFGAVPAPLARMAEAPALVAAFHALLAHFERTSLSLAEREVVTFVVATTNECHYCVAMHSRLAAEIVEVAALRGRTPLADARLEALRSFTIAVMTARGAVSDEELATFEAAGFGAQHALEVVVGIATYTLSTFANRLTRAPLDAALEPYRWPDP
jgi:uncharacterized peroxidase-related enzyme